MRQTESDTGKLVPEGFCAGAAPGASFPDCTGGIPLVTGSKVRKNSDTDTGTVFSASVTKLLESGQLSLTASRTTTPSSDGELLDTTRFIFNGEHRFTETLRTTLRAEYSNIEVIARASLNDRDDRDLYRIVPRIIWRFQREWQIAGRYEYAKKDEDDESGNATRNAFYLTLSYRPDKLFISR
jgi:predicted porin